MRLLFVCDSLIGRGAEKLLNDLLPLLEEDNSCDLLILTDENARYIDNLIESGISLHVLPRNRSSHFSRIQYIKNYIMNGSYDIVHANLFPVTYYCSLSKKIVGRRFPKLVMTEHNTDNKRRHIKFLRPIERWIYGSYDKIISINSETRELLVSWLHEAKDNNKFCVVNNGVPIRKFLDAQGYSKNTLFKNIGAEDILLGMVGAFTNQKNHRMAIDVLKKLPERYKLVLVGEGELEAEIRQMVAQYGLSKRVIFLGFRLDIPQLIKTVDIVIVPSKWEGFGLVAVEGMACGKPIIAADVKGLADVVGNGGIKVSTIEEFVDAILLLENEEIYRGYQETANTQAKKYDILNMKDKYEEIYRELVAGDENE